MLHIKGIKSPVKLLLITPLAFIIWLILGVVIFVLWLNYDIFSWLILLSFLWVIGGVGLLVVILVISNTRLWADKKPLYVIGNTLFLITAFILTWLYYPSVCVKIRFELQRPFYEKAMSNFSYSESEIRQSDNLIIRNNYIVDMGPPLRFAFLWPGGIMDNWYGVVYDPTDEVVKINTIKRNSNTNDADWRLICLFGGTLYRADSLGGHWYLCWFT